MSNVVCIGECMLELARAGSGWRLAYGGDTFNTALYMRRLGLPVAYLTALGADSFSAGMRTSWEEEGIDMSLVLTDATRLPGMYAITTNVAGERSFSYWRSQSAARRLFGLAGIESALAAARAAKLLYLSGITLSLFSPTEREALKGLARDVRNNGGVVAFDPNYRPAGWSDPVTARDAIRDFAAEVSIALPSFDDEHELWRDPTPEATSNRWSDLGARESIVKLGSQGCLVSAGGAMEYLPAIAAPTAVDTTGAGDSFNAAYLAARLKGLDFRAAAMAGNRLGSIVVQHAGAILPMTASIDGIWA